MPEQSILLRFYLPILVGFFVVNLARSVKVGGESQRLVIDLLFFTFPLPLPATVRDWPLPSWLKSERGVKGSVLVAGLAMIFFGLGADFSRFFPAVLKMDVYFDKDGIQRELSYLSAAERLTLRIAPEPWDSVQAAYVTEIKAHLTAFWRVGAQGQIPDTSGMARSNTHASGQTTFAVTRDGLLKYRIVDSEGELDVVADVPNRPLQPMRTFFSLTDSPHNHLRPSLANLLLGREMVIDPKFKQILGAPSTDPKLAPFDHIVVGATRVSILPVPNFSPSVYLLEQADGRRVPIGYAIYH